MQNMFSSIPYVRHWDTTFICQTLRLCFVYFCTQRELHKVMLRYLSVLNWLGVTVVTTCTYCGTV